MNISPVNNNVSSKGYVDKSVEKFVQRAVKNECQAITDSAKASHLPVDSNKLLYLKWYGDAVLKKLSEYFQKCHPDTNISVSYKSAKLDYVIKNDKLSQKASEKASALVPEIKGYDSKSPAPTKWVRNGFRLKSSLYKKIDISDVRQLNSYIDYLRENIDPREIDINLLKNMMVLIKHKAKHSLFFADLRALYHAENADLFARQIGEKSDAVMQTHRWLREAQTERKDAKIAKHQLKNAVNENCETFEDIIS